MELNSKRNISDEKCEPEYVPIYRSDNETGSEQSEKSEKLPKKRGRRPKPKKVRDDTPKKTRGKGTNWLYVKKFKSARDAEEAVRSENTWSIKNNRWSEEGRKQVYRCNKVKMRGPQCIAQVLLLFDAYSDDVVLFRKEFEHDHHLIGTRSGYHGIDPETKRNINALFDLHITKPRIVYNHLMEKPGLKMPTIMQLNNYLNDLRRRKYGCAASVGKVKKWITTRTDVPENDHEAFVISYCLQESSPKICYVLSTKKLLEFGSRSSVIHSNATCRLNWQGFDILIVGTTDMDGKLYPLCLAISSTDTAEVFKTLFNGLKDAITSMYTCFFAPSVLICDDEAIGDAFTSVFCSTPQVRTCWEHTKNEMKRAIDRMDEKKQNFILEDVECLHMATSDDDFDKAAELFLMKWEEEQDFTNYFREEWLVKRRKWYVGIANFSTTNDTIEAMYKEIKDNKIIYERLPAKRFLMTTCSIVTEWSENKNLNNFATKYTIKLKDWAEANQWLKLDRKTTVLHLDNDKTTYLVQSSKCPPISRTTYLQSNSSWKTFDEYRDIYFSHWKVTMIKDPQMWMDSKCTCPQFAMKLMCKHVLGLAVQLKYAVIPVEAAKMTLEKENIKVKEESLSAEPSSSTSLSNNCPNSKKIYTLAAEKKIWCEKDATDIKKNLRKSRLRSEIESALQKEKPASRKSIRSWSDQEDSDTKPPKTRKTKCKAKSSPAKKQAPIRSLSTFSSELNQDDLWSDQDWGQDSSEDWDSSRNIDNNSKTNMKLRRDSRKFDTSNSNMELRRDSRKFDTSNSNMELRRDSRKFDTSNSNMESRDSSTKSVTSKPNARLEDEFYFFGQSMAAQLRRLPINVALDLQVQFQNELTKARTKGMIMTSDNVVHSSTSVEKNPLEGYEMTVVLPSKIEIDESE